MSAQLQGSDTAFVLLFPAAPAEVHVCVQISRGEVLLAAFFSLPGA